MLRWQRSWFLLALLAVLIAGLTSGLGGPRGAAEWFLAVVQPSVTTAIVLFLMAFSLDSTRLHESLRRPAAALWGSLINLGLLPLAAYIASHGLSLHDFALGLIITSVAPCTLATASVFTRRAGGNDAISLLVTLLTNVACVVVTPLWLRGLISSRAEMDTAAIVQQLLVCVLAPTVLGQLCLWPRVGRAVADRYRRHIGFASQLIVLLLVAVAAVNAGLVLRRQPLWPSAGDVAAMLLMCLLVHVVGLAAGWYGGGVWQLAPEDRIATAIAGSQKTLPVGLLIATNPSVVSADAPFVTFPLLFYHAIQLVLDTAIADAWRARRATTAPEAMPGLSEGPASGTD
jgi:sodium/bile acid cotransporter 7